MSKYFKISGYWKDDQTKFDGFIVKDSDDVEPPTDDEIFFYGLNEKAIIEAIEAGVDTGLEFVITNYELCSYEAQHFYIHLHDGESEDLLASVELRSVLEQDSVLEVDKCWQQFNLEEIDCENPRDIEEFIEWFNDNHVSKLKEMEFSFSQPYVD